MLRLAATNPFNRRATMQFTFIVEVEVTRSEGKFATREELAQQLIDAIEQANPGDLTGDNEGQYTVDNFEVSEEDPRVKQAQIKAARANARAAAKAKAKAEKEQAAQ